MAPPAEKKKKHSSADHRLISSSAAIGGKQQQSLGSVMTSLGKRRSLRVAMKKNHRILRKIWICTDVLMDILPFFDRLQLGLKLALLSPRFNSLVDKHFDGKTELTISRIITIDKRAGLKPKLYVHIDDNYSQFPLSDRPLHKNIRFNYLTIEYIDHSVITFLRANQQIFDKGINLDLFMRSEKDVQTIWNGFAREIWPIFAPNIRHLNFTDCLHVENLRRHISPTILSELDIVSISSDELFPDVIADDGPSATAGQALSKWLQIPTKDGQPKRLSCCDYESESTEWINRFKEAFLRATSSSASYIIRIEHNEPIEIGPFELMNELTQEKLTFEKEKNDDDDMEEDDDNGYIDLVLKRWKIGETVQWEDKKTDNLNSVSFQLYKFVRLAPNAKSHLKMNPGPSGKVKEY